MTKSGILVLTALLMTSNLAYATRDCLKENVEGEEYPAAREKIIKAGWEPRYLSPPFEGAPYTDWVRIRNFAEVEACAGTGTAPCRFVFSSSIKENSHLLIFTKGEEIGIVTGYECTDKLDDY